MTISVVDIEGELSQLAAGTMRAGEMLRASQRIMAVAKDAQWSQAAAYHGRALYAQGRIAEALAMLEQAWRRADQLDDPIAGALAAILGGASCLTLYDYSQAEEWFTREHDRPRSRLVANLRRSLTDSLATARVCQGNLAGARELLAEFEGAAASHFPLAYHEGDWERAVLLLRKDMDKARADDRLFSIGDGGSILGRIARIGNQRVEAEVILDEALQASLTSADLNRELFIRLELALIHVDLGQFRRAREELQRSKEILDNGEDWRGHKGTFAHTCALLKAAEHILKFVSPDGRWHVALHRRSVLLPDEVAEGFRAAIEIFRRWRAPWEETATLLYWSQALFATSQIRESFEKFEAAFAIFDHIATPQWNARLQIELFHFVTLDTLSEPITVGDGAGSNVFRKEGDFWTVSFLGSMFRSRDTIGMHYLSRLLANPGMDFSAQHLVDIAYKATRKRGVRNARSSRSAAHANGVRPISEDADKERARVMVTKRIKDVIARIRHSHPELARYLATCIRTGYTCTYVVDDEHPTDWVT